MEWYTDYDFCKATQTLNLLLIQRRPASFDPDWIEQHDRYLYKYLSKHVKTETGNVDWDAVTASLERRFQKRWYWYKRRKSITAMPYENKEEFDIILASFESKLYTALVPQNKQDEKIQDKIFIRLVRTSQKGNVLAQKKVIEWLTIIVNEWIENSSTLSKWKGYPGDVTERIQGCILCYRYTGTFIGYVYKTFQCSARGLRSTCSLNDRVGKGTKTRIDYVIQE